MLAVESWTWCGT